MKSDRKTTRNIHTGILVSGSLLILIIAILFIGAEQKIFAKKYPYMVELENVTGLAEGNPVKMAGVTIGAIKDIRLPRDPKETRVAIDLVVDRKYAERIRSDSRARLKKLGLLAGDTFIDITPGRPDQPQIEPGELIIAQRQTDVEALIGSGEDLVDNLVAISYSLKNVLERVDRGEGLLGELTSEAKGKERLTDTLLVTLNRTNRVLEHVESGKGLVGRLVYDDVYGERLTSSLVSSVDSLNVVMSNVEQGFQTNSGALPMLLTDPTQKKNVEALLENLKVTGERLVLLTEALNSGDGLVPRLLNDREYAEKILGEFQSLVADLHGITSKIDSGNGTAGKLISDPGVYESINDILIGINESSMLRWLIRSRQKKGIEKRYDAATSGAPAPPDSPPASEPKPKISPPGDPEPPEIPPVDHQALAQQAGAPTESDVVVPATSPVEVVPPVAGQTPAEPVDESEKSEPSEEPEEPEKKEEKPPSEDSGDGVSVEQSSSSTPPSF